MTYLLSKAAAVATVIAMVTLGPPLLLLIGLSLQSKGPDGFLGFLGVLLRVVASGAALALIFSGVSLAIASLTDRRAVAAAATLLVVIGSSIVAGTWRFGLGGPNEAILLSLSRGPLELVRAIYGERNFFGKINTPAVYAGNLAWAVAGYAVAVVRYARLQVTR
jgi:ABC-2 type transport system permease protein